MIGQTISHYKIVSKLGEGGMGVVYKAEDLRLRRIVALKFLPKGLEAHEQERARFLQEAQAASALNHPNICAIHALEEYDAPQGGRQHFIDMEFVEGATLRRMIEAGGPTVDDAVAYAIQMCEALQEAHSHGVVHRDVKPENIMVNAKHQIKVMDFGLAKLKGSLKLTRTSSTVGTLAYMAPEQIQGGEVDARGDIFSFGIVLYEMLTGKLPFHGEHEAAMMYSILNEAPEPALKYRPELSPELLHILNRALEKDPEERYQSMHDMLIELRRVKKETSRVSRAHVPPPQTEKSPDVHVEHASPAAIARKRQRSLLLTGGSIGLVAAIAVVVYLLAPSSHAVRLNPNMTFHALEIPPVEVGSVGFSRDGNWLTFTAPDEKREWSVYFMNVARGNPKRLLTDHFREFGNAEISPDGSEVVFDAFTEKRLSAIYVVSSLGGPYRKVAENGFLSRWHPDGHRIGYIRSPARMAPESSSRSGKIEFWIVNADGRENHLGFVDSLCYIWGGYGFDWSPDGNSIAWLRSFPDNSTDIFIHELATGKERRLTNDRKPINDITWAQNDQIIFTSNRSGNTNVWVVPARGGETVQITKGSGPDLNVRVAADGRRLLCLEQQQVANIWRTNMQGTNTRQLTSENQSLLMPQFSPDKRNISFMIRGGDPLGGSLHVYTMDSDGTNRNQLILGEGFDYTPTWSPDGKHLAYGSFGKNERVDSSRVYVVEAANPSSPRLIGKGWWAFWPDSGKLVVIPWLSEKNSILYSLVGREPIAVSPDSTWEFPLRDGRNVLIRDLHKDAEGWWLETRQEGHKTGRTQILSSDYIWSSWPSASFRYLIYRQANGEIWRVSIPDGKRERLPEVLKQINPYFGQIQSSFDDQDFLFLKYQLDSKLVLIENVFE